MSPVNRAGSVSEISLRHSFLRKKFLRVHMKSWASPVTEILATGKKIFPYEHCSSGIRGETFLTKKLRFRNIAAKMPYFLSCMYFHFRSMRISFISKVTRVPKAMAVANDTSLFSLCF